MAKKLAITIAGAVSLSSYESGVAFEILDALSQHNQWAGQNQLPGERIEIDVLTGASAGGMTVAMIAQRLLFEGLPWIFRTTIRCTTHGFRTSIFRSCSTAAQMSRRRIPSFLPTA